MRHQTSVDHRLRATLVQIGCLALFCVWAAIGMAAVHELRGTHAHAFVVAHLHVPHAPVMDARRA